jgi:hypothetical protein
MRTVAVRGRWIWRLSGVATVAALGIPLGGLIVTAGQGGEPMTVSAVPTRTITIARPITSVSVESYGAAVYITGGPVRHAQVTEAITYGPQDAGPPAVTAAVSHGHLTLAAPDCAQSNCTVGFTVTVPSGVAVTAESDGGPVTVAGVAAANVDSGGGLVHATGISGQLTVSSENGPVMVSGTGAANLDSGGGPVGATDVRGPLTVNTEGGALTLDGLSGPLDADTGGAPLLARNVAAVTATVTTENGNVDMAFVTGPEMVSVDTGGGNARLTFAAAPKSVTVSTVGGLALLTVPGGPYALSADNGGGGGPEIIAIPTDPAAPRSITVTTSGGPLRIVK